MSTSSAPAAVVLTEEDYSELLETSRYGELEDLAALLSLGCDVNHVRAEDGSTALHMASANGHVAVVELLLQRGARHVANAAGNTPLHWACLNGHGAVVSLLLASAGAGEVDVYAKNSQGRSAFTVAISAGHDALARSMLGHASAEPPAAFAAGGSSSSSSAEGLQEGEAGEEDMEAEDRELLEGAASEQAASEQAASEAMLAAGGGGSASSSSSSSSASNRNEDMQ